MKSTPRHARTLALSAAALAVVALSGPAGAADTGSQQYVTTTTTPAQAESQQSHVDQDKLGISAMNHAVRGKSAPFIYADPGSVRPTLMLPGSPTPYDVADLATRFKSAFSELPGGGLVLDIPLEVADGATLRIDSATTPVFDLRSDDQGYAYLVGIHATIELVGTAATPLHIGSYDRSTGRADQDLATGRAYVAAEGSHMTLSHVEAADLGFYTGTASGMAWLPYGGVDASGSIESSSLTGNYFGAYSSNTTGFRVSDTEFADSIVYGFDLHDHAHNLVSRHERQFRLREFTVHDVQIGAAHGARLDPYQRLPGTGGRQRPFAKDQLLSCPLQHHRLHAAPPRCQALIMIAGP